MINHFLKEFKTYFITGLAVIFPIFLTIIILKWVLGKINLWFLEPFASLIRPYLNSPLLIFFLKIILFFSILILIVFIGVIAKIIFVRRFFDFGEQFLTKMPFISKIYLTTKEVSLALFGKKKGLFKKVVLIEFPRPGLFSVGFLTAEHIDRRVVKKPLNDDLVSVFVPTAPNPTTGSLVFVQKGDVIDVDMSVEEAIKLILSGGAISPYYKERKLE